MQVKTAERVRIVGPIKIRIPEVLQIELSSWPEDVDVRGLISQGWVNYGKLCEAARDSLKTDEEKMKIGLNGLFEDFGILMYDHGKPRYTYILRAEETEIRFEAPIAPHHARERILVPTRWAKTVLGFIRSGVTKVTRFPGVEFRLTAQMKAGGPKMVLRRNGEWHWSLRV